MNNVRSLVWFVILIVAVIGVGFLLSLLPFEFRWVLFAAALALLALFINRKLSN